MITTIGKLLYKLESYKLRFINRYKLSRLGSHGANCHIEGIINMSLSNVYIGNNVFIPTGATFLLERNQVQNLSYLMHNISFHQ